MLGISIKVVKQDKRLDAVIITPYEYSTKPSDAIATWSADYGRVLRLEPKVLSQPQLC